MADRENRLVVRLPQGMSQQDVKGTLDGLAKALGLPAPGVDPYNPKAYDVIMGLDYNPMLLLPCDNILGSQASYARDGQKDTVEATISIRCSAQAWTSLVNGARR